MRDASTRDDASPARYRGGDRRLSERTQTELDVGHRAGWTLATTAVAVVLVAIALLAAPIGAEDAGLAALSRGAALGLVLTLALGTQLYWRTSGDAAGYRIAAAGWLFGAGLLLEALDLHRSVPGATAVIVAHLLAITCVGHAVLGATVDSRGSVLRQLAVVVPAGVLAWVLTVAALATTTIAHEQVLVVGWLLLALGWTAATALTLTRVPRRRAPLDRWLSGVTALLAAATLARGLTALSTADLAPSAAVLGIGALLIGATGTYQALAHRADLRRVALHRTQRAQRDSQARRTLAEREHRHEVRNALLAIEGATRTLRLHRDALDPAQRARLDQALASGIDHLHRLLLSEGQAVGEPAPVPVDEVLDQRVELARVRGVAVEVDDHAAGARALGHRHALAQIVDNLLSNVERHGVAHDGTSSATVTVRCDAAEIRIQVSDDGPGLPAGTHERVFDRGYQAGSPEHGEGIGLAVARRLARQQGGDLEARPSQRGACFELRLPRAVEPGGGRA